MIRDGAARRRIAAQSADGLRRKAPADAQG
jgi:hypothetical protein